MLGAQIKAGISQYLAIEMTRREGQDHRFVVKYLPWLYSLPTVTVAKGKYTLVIINCDLLIIKRLLLNLI